ncbi:MAG: hypothetical protein JNL67_09840 [Planctomycetaceae bacterium]|nr:hypothetical protein [Planctomycetaceae bacterium]
MFQVYNPSGRFSPLALVLMPIAAIAVVALSYVYQLGLYWIPLIYVNFLLTWCMGMAIGKAGEFVIVAGHVRNVAVSIFLLAILVVLGLGAKFGFQYIHARIAFAEQLSQWTQQELGVDADRQLDRDELERIRKVILADYTFLRHIEDRVASGWHIGRGAKAPVSGPIVYLVWITELGIIVYFGGTVILEAARRPYSEKLGRWANSVTNEMSLPITNPVMVAKISTAKSVQDLLTLPIPDTDESDKVAVYQVHSVPNASDEDAYLSVDLQTYSRNAKGEIEVAHEYLVKLAIITAAERAQLKENAELMQEALEAYRASLANRPTEPEATDEEPEQA